MTIDLDELERLGKAATTGEWEASGDMVSTPPAAEVTRRIEADDFPIEARRICMTRNYTYMTYEECAANARFIAAARNNWQAMIDELREFQGVASQIIKHHDRGTLSESFDSLSIERLRKLLEVPNAGP